MRGALLGWLMLAASPALALAQAETEAETPLPRAGGIEIFKFRAQEDPEAPLPEYGGGRDATVSADAATLRLLDKMNGRVFTFDMQPGETREIERLEIALRTCQVPAEDARADAVAYLEIRDFRDESPRFSGWMFASSPALSAMDHQRYDVWVLSCSTSSAEADAGNE